MDSIATMLVVIPGAPLLAAVLIALTAPRLMRRVYFWPAYVTIAALVVSAVASLQLYREIAYRHDFVKPSDPTYERVVELWTWAAVPQALWKTPQHPNGDAVVPAGGKEFRVSIALRADGLTSMMLAMVSCIALIVAIYSTGYMRGDKGYWRYFSYFCLFVFSMTMLVSASNFVLLYVFWEAVGLCSYLLIGFWYEKPEAAAAGKKAFLVNRVGDFGFALALMLIWITYGTLDFHSTAIIAGEQPQRVIVDSELILSNEATVTPGVLTRSDDQLFGGAVGLAICLLLMLGACGKSAQFPLHVWLPDAMEGPTPVSALIHAATMVTAGVYMVARCTPLFLAVPEAQLVVASIGAFTCLLAALIAVTQFDLKRVLAYSTISQLGYMFLGLGAGTFAGITSGMFHLFTHAFFKALLFLGAGSVMHAMGNVIDMRRFGGLRRILPVTHWTFLIGCLALAGFFPLSGFWSKDAILGAVHDRLEELTHSNLSAEGGHAELIASPAGGNAAEHEPKWTYLSVTTAATIYRYCYYAALATVFLTAYYAFRAFFMTFYGELRVPAEAEHHAHESPPVMAVPLIVLAIGAAVAGFLLEQSYRAKEEILPGGRVSSNNALADFIGYTPMLAGPALTATRHAGKFHLDVATLSFLLALGGLFLAMFFYLESRREAEWLSSVLRFQWYRRLLDIDTVARMQRWPWVVRIREIADRAHLGWLASFAGQLILAVFYILTIPLILFYFISPYRLSADRFYWDEIYDWTVVRPLRAIAHICAAIDRWFVDGLVELIARVPMWAGNLMRSLQVGVFSFYALSMILGACILLVVRWLWGA
jgi:NADH-quinone oxidoreductase subunit L